MHCCRSGKVYENMLRLCYFGVLPLLCPPPCCHNIEFQEEKTWDRAEQWHLSWVHHSIKQQHRTLRNKKQAQLHLAEVNTVFICFVWTRRDMILLYFFLIDFIQLNCLSDPDKVTFTPEFHWWVYAARPPTPLPPRVHWPSAVNCVCELTGTLHSMAPAGPR